MLLNSIKELFGTGSVFHMSKDSAQISPLRFLNGTSKPLLGQKRYYSTKRIDITNLDP